MSTAHAMHSHATLFHAALAAHQQGRLDDARTAYLQFLQAEAGHADALHMLGVVHLQRREPAEAEKRIRQALALEEKAALFANLGNALKDQRRLDEAEAAFRRALLLDPDDASTHNNLGVLLKEGRRPDEAEAAYRRALTLRPDYAEALNNLANLLRKSGRLDEAEAAYRRALELRPDYAEALNNLGVLLKNSRHTQDERDGAAAPRDAAQATPGHARALNDLGNRHQTNRRPAEAEAAYRQALEAWPEYAEAHNNLGVLLKNAERLAEAEAAFRRALSLKPDYVAAWNNLGNLLQLGRRLAEAEAAYRQALALKPDYAEACNNLGLLLQNSGRWPEAEASFRRAVELRPGYADAHQNLGNLLKESSQPVEAEAAYRRALALKPDYAEAHNNLGLLLKSDGRLAEAEATYRRALEFQPDRAEIHNNLGIMLKTNQRLAEAEAAHRRALEIAPAYVEARLSLCLLLLSTRRYAEAWPLYESRYAPERKTLVVPFPSLPWPQWRGESLAGKSLVIWPEQGFGDYIQFVRYAPMLKARGVSRLTLLCRAPLAALLETVDGVDAVVTDESRLPAHDYWCFVLSLPLHFSVTAETIGEVPIPYLHALPARVARWQKHLPTAGRKVGLVWKGSPGHGNDANRSLPGLASLAPLWRVSGVAFISLQKGQGEEEASSPPAGQPLIALGAQMEDFADAAAIVSRLDLVICVDTAVAHLAGALGKPCWVMLPAVDTDWRWGLEGSGSAWYPGLRLFRQARAQDWRAAIDEITAALDAWARPDA
ncbi:tetratricopeptide repeat protein [Polaromonas sp. YR568]|uniref:tetratricopeptide repeat protein n=1 Tax=Polaromonas sp. YR568 TaxID=1855301 RepID=UPI00398BE9B0